MPNYTSDQYKKDCILLQNGLRGKRPVDFILKNYYQDASILDKKSIRFDIVNILNGNSYQKSISTNIFNILKEVYKIKTGKQFKSKINEHS